MTTDMILLCIGSGMIGAGIVLWGQMIRQYLRDRRALAAAKQRAYLELFSTPARPASHSKSQGKPRLYKV